MKNKKALIIDGNSMMFRAFYATYKQLNYYQNNNITPKNALKTMAQMLFNILQTNEYDYLVAAFDAKGGSFRNEISNTYKANRKSTPTELIDQIPSIHKFCELIGFNVFCVSGIEADDVVGSSSKLLASNNIKCDIITSDRDMLQLVDDLITVKIIINGGELKEYNLDNFAAQYHDLKPYQVIDFKSIAGDQSDNILGVKGIGEKGAINLIKEFGTLELIYENIDKIASSSIRKKLIDSKEDAFLSKKMVSILLDFFIDKDLYQFQKKNIDYEEIRSFFSENNVSSLERYLV